MQTKSGTNDFHGSLFEYSILSRFKARPFFLPANRSLPRLTENDFGGSLGGRIIRDKLFFFGSYEGDFNNKGNNNIVTVPTAAIKSGDMSGSNNPIYDPATGNPNGTGRVPFPNKIIPANRISPIVQKLNALIPLPNLAGAATTIT